MSGSFTEFLGDVGADVAGDISSSYQDILLQHSPIEHHSELDQADYAPAAEPGMDAQPVSGDVLPPEAYEAPSMEALDHGQTIEGDYQTVEEADALPAPSAQIEYQPDAGPEAEEGPELDEGPDEGPY